jgi:transcriptional regulator with XRE-family HTH domain
MFAVCLAACRAQHGYSLAEVAARLHALSRETEGFDAGPTPKTVWRWERGVQPCNRYRRLLCRLYGVSAAELGFRPASGSEMTLSVDVTRSADAVDMSKARVFEAADSPTSAADVDPELVEHWLELRGLLTGQDDMFGAGPVLSFAARGTRIISRYRSIARGDLRVDLMRLEGRWELLLAWLRDDLGDAEAVVALERALTLALEAQDSLMVGYVLARQAERAARLGAADAAIGLAQAAQRQRHLTVSVRALSVLYEALGHGLAGNAYDCEQRLDEAYELVEQHGDIDVTWDGLGRHYATRTTVLAGEARCRLWLGQAVKAVDAANAALAEWPATRRRGGGLQRAGLAIACAAAGQTERAADEGLKALTVARETRSARTMHELHRLDRRLGSVLPNDRARDFHDALASVA